MKNMATQNRQGTFSLVEYCAYMQIYKSCSDTSRSEDFKAI